MYYGLFKFTEGWVVDGKFAEGKADVEPIDNDKKQIKDETENQVYQFLRLVLAS